MNPKEYSIENILRLDVEGFINCYEIALFTYNLYNFKKPIIQKSDEEDKSVNELESHTAVFDKQRIFNRIEQEIDFIHQIHLFIEEGNFDEEEIDSFKYAFILLYLDKRFTELAIECDVLLVNDEKNDIKIKLKEISNISQDNKNYLDVLKNTEDSLLAPKANAKQKIAYLNELGVIDFLIAKQPFSTSENSLAIILSTILGENTTTLQSYLNPLITKDTSSHNHPYSSEKAIDNIKNNLNKIGFKK